jgi:hypothetical protein
VIAVARTTNGSKTNANRDWVSITTSCSHWGRGPHDKPFVPSRWAPKQAQGFAVSPYKFTNESWTGPSRFVFVAVCGETALPEASQATASPNGE